MRETHRETNRETNRETHRETHRAGSRTSRTTAKGGSRTTRGGGSDHVEHKVSPPLLLARLQAGPRDSSCTSLCQNCDILPKACKPFNSCAKQVLDEGVNRTPKPLAPLPQPAKVRAQIAARAGSPLRGHTGLAKLELMAPIWDSGSPLLLLLLGCHVCVNTLWLSACIQECFFAVCF